MVDEESETGYLFRNGQIIDFEDIIAKEIDYRRVTGALRIRTTEDEVDVDFIEEIRPTKEQVDRIKKLKTPDRKLFFEIIDKNNKHIRGFGGFDKSIEEMEEQINEFYGKK